MQTISHELGVLAKSIHYKNLSAAAMHVGLSQPQLSRIIARIEEELKIVVLDRSAKRKSGWTPVAFQLAELYDRSNKRLEAELHTITSNQLITELHIGTLEGLSKFALSTAKVCFEKVGVKKISVDIFDLSELEANFMSGNLDIIFTSKSPGRQKFKHVVELGFQLLEKVQTNKNYAIFSSFEHGRIQKKEMEGFKHVMVSNSLSLRREWLNSFGGTGNLPTETRKGRSKEHEPVFLIGSELLSPILWNEIATSIDK